MANTPRELEADTVNLNNKPTNGKNKGSRRDKRKPGKRPGKSTNDPAWYNKSSVLVANAANLDFNWPAGTFSDLNSDILDGFSVPGLMSLEVVPTIGKSGDPSDPINRAAVQLLLDIRGSKSGTSPYDQCDIAMGLMAFGNLYAYVEWLKRAYRIVGIYSDSNKYMPRVLLEANHLDPDDFTKNRNILRTGINELINAIATFNIPNTMTYFDRIRFLFKYIYREGESLRDQMYMFVPAGFHTYRWSDNEEGLLVGQLHYQTLVSGPELLTVDTVLQKGWDMLNAIMYDTDIYQLSSDIKERLGDAKLMKFDYLTDQDILDIKFDPVVLEQIHNARIVPVDHNSLHIVQKRFNGATGPYTVLDQNVVAESAVKYHGANGVNEKLDLAVQDYLQSNILLTAPGASVSVDDVMEFTRFITTANKNDIDTETGMPYLVTGSDIILAAKVWSINRYGSYDNREFRTVDYLDLSDPEGIMIDLEKYSYTRTFKFAPNMFIYYADASGMITNAMFFGAVDNYTLTTPERVSKLHLVALQSLFSVLG